MMTPSFLIKMLPVYSPLVIISSAIKEDPMPKGRKHTDAHKNWILQRLALGACMATLCREYGLCPSVVGAWKSQAKADGRWTKMLAVARRAPGRTQKQATA